MLHWGGPLLEKGGDSFPGVGLPPGPAKQPALAVPGYVTALLPAGLQHFGRMAGCSLSTGAPVVSSVNGCGRRSGFAACLRSGSIYGVTPMLPRLCARSPTEMRPCPLWSSTARRSSTPRRGRLLPPLVTSADGSLPRAVVAVCGSLPSTDARRRIYRASMADRKAEDRGERGGLPARSVRPPSP